ncbi:MAG: S-layer homology domain-containing protein [Clostridiales bacterium]|nr:S-layer homology domain-containing protein [Clostridiales bacterium]
MGENKGYYLTANNASGLNAVFQQIVEKISTLNIVADKDTILSDTLSEYFTLNVLEGKTEKDAIKVEKVICTGVDDKGKYTWGEPVVLDEADVTIDDKTIKVTGFDYTANAVTKTDTGIVTTYSGYKLVVTIPIKQDTTTAVTNTDYYPTNDTENSRAGLSNYKDKDGNGLDPTLLNESPMVMIEVPEDETYTVTYTDGVENEEVFEDQIFTDLKSGETTPAFNGDLIRDGYTFTGWNPTVSETVTKNVTYTAQWKLNSDDPIDPPFIVIFPTLEISNKVIAPKNFEKTSFEYDIINVKTGDVEKSVTLKADSSVRVMVTGGTEYMVVPKNLEVPGYIVTTTSTPDSATVTSDKIGNVSVDFTHIYVVGLNTEDHYAYIRGYEDGTIRPEGNITRAEVATIFYRLLSSEALAAFKTTENTFTDVDSDAWYNLSVSTLAKAGVISGYPDGSFNPNGKITRAELVSIATRFFTTIEVGDSKFSDIAGHWAAKAIDEAYIKGIIKGYSDGTFRPDQAVTRAEAMKIVNGILGRPIDTCVLIEGIKLWPDVASDAWYYYVVAEATNAHRYELTTPEKWTAIIINEIEY